MIDSEKDRHNTTRQTGERSPEQLESDQFYRALSSIRRRQLLFYLLEQKESTVEQLATVLSGWKATSSGMMCTASERSEIRLTLIHHHLPQLVEANLIDYDPRDGSVQIASLHPQVAEIIRQSIETDDA